MPSLGEIATVAAILVALCVASVRPAARGPVFECCFTSAAGD